MSVHHRQIRTKLVWAKLGARTRLMLQRLNDCTLLRESDLEAFVWAEAVSRQARTERLARWQADQLVQVVRDAHSSYYQLGQIGARLLREAGFRRIASVRPIAARARDGLLLANQFGAALHSDILYERAIRGMAWTIAPFSGRDARGDGLAALCYRLDGQSVSEKQPNAYIPLLAADDYTPDNSTAVQRFVVEIDSGTETQQQLERRARQWRKRWERTTWPPATHAVFLWITTAGSARLETIWRAWTHYALLPAFFTTTEALAFGAGEHWNPWIARRFSPDGRSMCVWRDMYGRPRSLCPWEDNEPHWRFEQPVPVAASSLQTSIEAWSMNANSPILDRASTSTLYS